MAGSVPITCPVILHGYQCRFEFRATFSMLSCPSVGKSHTSTALADHPLVHPRSNSYSLKEQPVHSQYNQMSPTILPTYAACANAPTQTQERRRALRGPGSCK